MSNEPKHVWIDPPKPAARLDGDPPPSHGEIIAAIFADIEPNHIEPWAVRVARARIRQVLARLDPQGVDPQDAPGSTQKQDE